MSLEAVKSVVTALPFEERKELLGFILDLNRDPQEIAERRRKLAEARDDTNPKRWVTLEEFKERVETLASERVEE